MDTTSADVSCEDCGACCMFIGRPPFVLRRDGSGNSPGSDAESAWKILPSSLKLEVLQAQQSQTPAESSGPCIWLDLGTLKCRQYEHRPQACRNFEVGDEACLLIRSEFEV